MIDFVNNNLLDATENIIVHQVNCQGVMGSGIALQIKKKWPQVYTDYIKRFAGERWENKSLLGSISATQIGERKYVVNLYSQLNYGGGMGRYTNYEAIYTALENLAAHAKSLKYSVAIPYRLGSDRGGANWDIIYKMIEVLFKGIDVTIYKLEEN